MKKKKWSHLLMKKKLPFLTNNVFEVVAWYAFQSLHLLPPTYLSYNGLKAFQIVNRKNMALKSHENTKEAFEYAFLSFEHSQLRKWYVEST